MQNSNSNSNLQQLLPFINFLKFLKTINNKLKVQFITIFQTIVVLLQTSDLFFSRLRCFGFKEVVGHRKGEVILLNIYIGFLYGICEKDFSLKKLALKELIKINYQ